MGHASQESEHFVDLALVPAIEERSREEEQPEAEQKCQAVD